MDECKARLRAAFVGLAEEGVNDWYLEDIEDAIDTLDGVQLRHTTVHNVVTQPGEDVEGRVTMVCAAAGRLDLLADARAFGYPWTYHTCYYAANDGRLECLKYAHEHGCPWNEHTCASAAENGQLECLKYAHENGCPWTAWACQCAAWGGQLECLKYAHEHGCPWDEATCAYAARNGRLECLKYAHENGCPWTGNEYDQDPYIAAIDAKSMECILYMCERDHERTRGRLQSIVHEVAMPILPDADTTIGLEIALSRHRHRHDGGHVSLREILPFWREHRRLYYEAHRAAKLEALTPVVDEERQRMLNAGIPLHVDSDETGDDETDDDHAI